MEALMGEEFLLDTEWARRLYHGHGEGLPIVDFASHLDVGDILEDKRYRDLAEAWLKKEPGRTRLLRSGGVDERYITGATPGREKFRRYAKVLPQAVGHPLQLWSNLELHRWFGCEKPLSPATEEEIWERAGAELAKPEMSARGLLRKAGVSVLMIREDPASELRHYKRLRALPKEALEGIRILPAFEADAAFAIQEPDWENYMRYTLGYLEDIEVATMADVRSVTSKAMDLFAGEGCRTAILHFPYPFYRGAEEYELDDIVGRAVHGKGIPANAGMEAYQTALLLHLAKECRRRRWVLQLTYDVLEGGVTSGAQVLHTLFATLERMEWLPRCIVTSRNPADDDIFCRIAGTYHFSGNAGTIQPGFRVMSVPESLEAQLRNIANRAVLGVLPGYAQRAWTFLEYPRQEIFRRVLCRFLGHLVAREECPADEALLGEMVENVCFRNAMEFFTMNT